MWLSIQRCLCPKFLDPKLLQWYVCLNLEINKESICQYYCKIKQNCQELYFFIVVCWENVRQLCFHCPCICGIINIRRRQWNFANIEQVDTIIYYKRQENILKNLGTIRTNISQYVKYFSF